MTARMGVRLDDDLRERLTDFAQARGVDCSTVLRNALAAYLDGTLAVPDATPMAADSPPATPHTHDQCAAEILQYCPIEVQDMVARWEQVWGDPLARALGCVLTVHLYPEEDSTPDRT